MVCYTLTTESYGSKIPHNQIIEHFRRSCADAEYALSADGSAANEAKWYTMTDELTEFSKNYPKTLFAMTCLGEEGTRWKEYFLNGKTQHCEAILSYEPCHLLADEFHW